MRRAIPSRLRAAFGVGRPAVRPCLLRSLLAMARLLQRTRPLLRFGERTGFPRAGRRGLGKPRRHLPARLGTFCLASVALTAGQSPRRGLTRLRPSPRHDPPFVEATTASNQTACRAGGLLSRIERKRRPFAARTLVRHHVPGAAPPIILVIAAAAVRTSGPSAAIRSGVTRTVGPEMEMPPIGSPNSLKIAAATQRMPG